MNKKEFFKIRLYFTAGVTLLIWMLLVWNHFHVGVPRHHILANEDLPAISNWWGAALLPLLTWFLLYRIEIRISSKNQGSTEISADLKKVLYGFTGALFFGVLLSFFFSFGYADICGYMVLALLPIAVLFPVYRAECLLGFVIGMTYTFGAVLPTGIGLILALIGAVLYVYLRAGFLYIVSKFASKASLNK
jgi:hypothetical protein